MGELLKHHAKKKIMQSEISQIQKDKYCMIQLI